MTTAKNIFVNLAVKDLEKSVKFFTDLGFEFNPQFTDKNAACLVIGEGIYAMLLLENFFRRFTKKELVDAFTQVECLTALSVSRREEVDELTEKALELGAVENLVPDIPKEDFMYGRSWSDLDGHIWEIIWMDPSAIK